MSKHPTEKEIRKKIQKDMMEIEKQIMLAADAAHKARHRMGELYIFLENWDYYIEERGRK